MKTLLMILCLGLATTLPVGAVAAPTWSLADDTRYMALGDSLAAGYGAHPATMGYVYRLYRRGTFDHPFETLLTNAAVPGATSADVLAHQVPMALSRVRPDVITVTVGGNDLLAILQGADPTDVLAEFQTNLTAILAALRSGLPETEIVVANLYVIDTIPGASDVVPLFNQIVDGVTAAFDVPVADLYTTFDGQSGLLLIERPGADPFEVHPTNRGHRAIANAFRAAYLAY